MPASTAGPPSILKQFHSCMHGQALAYCTDCRSMYGPALHGQSQAYFMAGAALAVAGLPTWDGPPLAGQAQAYFIM
eukprot:4918910-Lingulodinium_polyedra.AAC.1